jgi:hypothetical protein
MILEVQNVSIDPALSVHEKMGWMPLSPTASKCAKLVVLDSQEKGEGIHEGS